MDEKYYWLVEAAGITNITVMEEAPQYDIRQGNWLFDINFLTPFLFFFRFEKQLTLMHLVLFVPILSLAACMATPNPPITAKDSAVLFVGTTPCGNVIRPLHQIKPEPDCEIHQCQCIMVEWKLTLYQDPVTHKPTRYTLTGINRHSVKETNRYSQPGTRTESEGKWTIIHGTKTNPNAILYQLNPGKSEIALSFLKLSDNLLHVVDAEGRLMIGNEFWSYTLSRVTNH